MNQVIALSGSMPEYDNVRYGGLSLDALRKQAPAVFTTTKHERCSERYRFIDTAAIVAALGDVGLTPVEARQSKSRRPNGALHARHLLRFRPVREQIEIGDTVGEITLVNSHDGAGNYQLLGAMYRALCGNGMILRLQECGAISIPHRGSVVDDVVLGAQAVVARLHEMAPRVEAMQKRVLTPDEQLALAESGLRIRYEGRATPSVGLVEMLEARRDGDEGDDLWRVYNRVQESCLRGGLEYRSKKGRLMKSRAIRAIRDDIRINTALWTAATAYLN